MWFSKYSASGNDFLICHLFKKGDFSTLAKKLCHRFNGIGADGLVILLPSDKCAYQWDFYNSDGSSAEMCGNAARCVGHYALNNHLASANHSFLSKAGKIKVSVQKNIVQVNLGKVKIIKENIEEFGRKWTLLDSGVPHLVSFGTHKNDILEIEKLKILRQQYNANVNCAFIDKNAIYQATFERGVEGITQACGTGMAACFHLANNLTFIADSAIVIPPSGDKLSFQNINGEVYFSGAVRKICDIVVDLALV